MKNRGAQIAEWLRINQDHSSGTLLGQGYQATVRLYDSPYGPLVVKSAHDKGFRGRAAKAALSHEAAVYARLDGIRGIAECHGLIDGRHLVLQYVSGPSLREYEQRIADRERFFGRLLETLQALHAAGVAHGDLKRKDNTLVGPDEVPYLIDFGIACLRRPDRSVLNRYWFELIRQMDYNAWTKLKYGRRPEGLSPEDAARYRPLWIERIARWIRVPWQKITLRRPRQRWRKKRARRTD